MAGYITPNSNAPYIDRGGISHPGGMGPQWEQFWESEASRRATPTPATNVSGLQIAGTKSSIGPGGETEYSSVYGPNAAGSAALAGLSGAGSSGGSSSSSSDAAQRQKDEIALLQERARLARIEDAAGLAAREALNVKWDAQDFARYQGMQTPQPTISRVGGAIGAQEEAARQAAFARAKEQSAQVAQSSLHGLRNSLSGRGITGGGYAAMQTAGALMPAAEQLQDFGREQMIQQAGQASKNADTEYAGQVEQRGQNVNSTGQILDLLKSKGRIY